MAEKLRSVLPPELVHAINEHMDRVGEHRDNFLDWEADCSVGDCCTSLAWRTTMFISKLGDHQVIDTSGIWKAVAHQCHIYAYS